MPTPSIQTLRTDAQQVLNLDSISAVRSVVAATLANANAGTPLNPNLTTQQLWNEFYQIVTQPKSDIESIIANQLMKFLYAPPAPGGAGANGQVIFNDGGVLAGDAGLTYNKTTDALTITGDLTVDTSTLKVDSTNNRVGIGTASPATDLHIFKSSATDNALIQLQNGTASSYIGTRGTTYGAVDAGDTYIFNSSGNDIVLMADNAAGAIKFAAGGNTESMRLNSTGLGVGASPAHKLQAVGGYVASGKLASASSGDIGGLLMYCSTDNGGRRSWGLKAESGTTGVLGFWLSSANNTEPFSGTQVMSLDASGNLLVGTTTNTGTARIYTEVGGNGHVVKQTSAGGYCFGANAFSNGGTYYLTYFEAAGTAVGSITSNGTGVTYGTLSDYRLKEAVQPLVGGLARVSALKPSIYKWKSNGSSGEGFIAHELAEVVPAAVTGEKDAVNEDGTVNPQGVDLSKVVPILVAAIQELTARVQTLEAK